MTAPSYVNEGAAAANAGAVQHPASMVEGNLLWVWLFQTGSPITPSDSAWTVVPILPGNYLQAAWRRVDATLAAGGAANVSFTGGAAYGAQMFQFSGVVDSGTPYDFCIGAADGSGTPKSPVLSDTTDGDDRLLFWYNESFALASITTPPIGFTLATSASANLHHGYKTQAAAGATGPVQSTGSTGRAESSGLVAFTPADTGGGDPDPDPEPANVIRFKDSNGAVVEGTLYYKDSGGSVSPATLAYKDSTGTVTATLGGL